MLKVLVVDDEKMPRDILVNYIQWESLGVSVVEEADDGVAAINLALKMEPDIIISDIKMPRMDGIQFAENVRKHLPECKFIFLSGYSDKEYLKSAIKLKAISYVEKPINLEEVTEVLKSAVAEYIEEKEKRKESLELAEQKLCLDLIGSSPDISGIAEKIARTGKNFTTDSKYITAVIKFNLEDKPDIRKKILVILETLLKQVDTKYIMGLKGEDYCIIHFEIPNCYMIDNLQNTFETFISEAKKSLGELCRLFIGFGHIVDSLDKLRISYQKAVISIQKHFFRGYNKCIFYSEGASNTYEFDEDILSLMDEYIKAGKECETEILVKRLFNKIKTCENTNPDSIRSVLYKVVLNLSRLAEDRNITLFEAESKDVLRTISAARTLVELEDNILKLISSVFRYLNSTDNSNMDILAKITKYINTNFYDENLSINSIAQNLNLTPTYLCMVFKRDTGKTINQYITSLRVEKAKEYLKVPDIKLYDIARRVGYNDGKYFTKVFAKTVGINPKEYREIHCRDKKST